MLEMNILCSNRSYKKGGLLYEAPTNVGVGRVNICSLNPTDREIVSIA